MLINPDAIIPTESYINQITQAHDSESTESEGGWRVLHFKMAKPGPRIYSYI